MIEENGKQPMKESELDITELLRRYMEEDADVKETEAPAAKVTETVDEVKEYAKETEPAKPHRRRRMTATRMHGLGETEQPAETEAEAVPVQIELPIEDVTVAPVEAETETVTDSDDALISDLKEIFEIEASDGGAETEKADEAPMIGEALSEPEQIEVNEVTEADGSDTVEAVDLSYDIEISDEDEDEGDDGEIRIFDSLEDFEENGVSEHSSDEDSTNVFDFVEPGAKSFDHDIDVFAEFEEPEDELYGDSDADLDVKTELPESETLVMDAVSPALADEPAEDGGTLVFDAVTEESQAPTSADVDDFDVNIMLALGMEEELQESIGEENVTTYIEKQQGDIERIENLNRERSRLEYEYTSKTQTREVASSYAAAKRMSLVKIIYSLALTLILALFECQVMTLDGAFSPTVYPVVYIMVGLQLLLLAAAPAYKSIWSGIRDFFAAKPAPESVASFALVLNVLYSFVICFSDVFGEAGPMTFNLPVAVMFVMLYVSDHINIRREMLSFGVVSSKKQKFALENLTMSESHLEHEAFSDMMDEDDDADDIGVLKVECADFVGDYFLRTNRYPNGRKFIGFIVPAAIVIAAAFFAFGYNGTGTLYGGMKAAVSTALVCMPVSVFYMFSHPFYMANLKASEDESTIIGESSAEEYADAAIISFDDKNVFPSTGVNVRAINVFGNNRIDVVLYYAASVFCTVGGPLSDVFDIATRDIGYSQNVKLIRTLPGLLEAEVDGSKIAFGTIEALEASGVKIPSALDPHRNDVFEPVVSVMYMVKDGKFISRMLISYVVDAEFEFILKQLDRGGMFIGLKTFDPNITEDFLGAQIKLSDYPIRIIRCKSLDEKTKVAETTTSGLVSKESPKSVIQTVALCEKVLHARSINTMLVIISLFVSLVLAALSLLFGAFSLTPLFISLYALAWILPMFAVSKIII